MSVDDYLVALRLHKQLNEDSSNEKKSPVNVSIVKTPTTSIVDPEWEMTDPNPDIHSLFSLFNVKFFWNALGAVEVKWSPRMYTCAGICTYKGSRGCIVSLSLPLLKFRPRKDLIETLLHEMIHAYLFLTKNNRDRGSHGPEFCKHMDRINKEAGTHITIYHSFHDEVNHYKTHVWRCNGSCKANPPYFGYVKRAINRAPGPNDFWFPEHKRTCGGSFEKVAEPDNFKAKPRKKLKTDLSSEASNTLTKKKPPLMEKNQTDLKNFFSSTQKDSSSKSPSAAGNKLQSVNEMNLKVHSANSSSPSFQSVGVSKPKLNNLNIGSQGGLKSNIHGFGNLATSRSEKEENFKMPVVPFAGKGYVLGSGAINDKSKSRLLGNYVPNNEVNPVPKESPPPSTSSVVYFEDLTADDFKEEFDYTSANDSDEDLSHLNCPVCNAKIKRGVSINEHLDDCAQLESVFNSSKHDTLSSDSDSDNDDALQREFSVSDSDNDDTLPSVSKPAKRPSSPPVNCPNCPAVLTASTINQHLDQCLIFD